VAEQEAAGRHDGRRGVTDDPRTARFYHGTRADLAPGSLVEPSKAPEAGARENLVFLTQNVDEAIWEAELADGDAPARVYVVELTGPIGDAASLTGRRPAGHPTMSLCAREPLRVVGEVTEWPLYHGTRADLQPGDLIEPGRTPNFGDRDRTTRNVYLSRTLDAATWGAELAVGDGPGRIYIVEPTGPIEDDPNLTDKKFRGNPTKSFRSRQPLRVIGEIVNWQGHAPDVLQAMKDGLARLKQQGAAIIDD